MGWFSDEQKNKPPNSGAQGDYRWAIEADLERIGALDERAGLPVGFMKGKPFVHPAKRKPGGLIIGNTGSGKTTQVLAPIALSDAASKMSIIAVDTASDYSGIVIPYRSRLGPCWIIDPLDMLKGIPLGKAKRARYSPTVDYLRAGDRLRFASRAAKLSAMCCPTDGTHDKFFYKLSKRGLRGGIMGQALHAPQNCDLPSIAKLFNGDFLGWVTWLLSQGGIDETVRDLLNPFRVRKGKVPLNSIQDVIHTVASEMEWILNEAIADSLKTSDFNIERFATEVCTGTLCVPLNAMDDGFDRWLSMILSCFLTQLQNTRGKVPVVFIFDEFAQYSSDVISKLIARLYSTGRKYNLRAYIVATSVGQLERDCFPHGRHHDILGNSGVTHILNVSDPESSRFVQSISGEKTAYSISRSSSSQSGTHSSSSSSHTVTPHGVPVIRQESVRGIADNTQVVLLDQCPYLIYAETKSFEDIPKAAARAGKNVFWSNDPKAKNKPRSKRKKVDEVAILLKAYGR